MCFYLKPQYEILTISRLASPTEVTLLIPPVCTSVQLTQTETSLLNAKSQINPVAKVTTSRSKLCGAALLANLMNSETKSVDIPFTSIHCWTDSNVVLGRLFPSKKLPVFELNRIRKISIQHTICTMSKVKKTLPTHPLVAFRPQHSCNTPYGFTDRRGFLVTCLTHLHLQQLGM